MAFTTGSFSESAVPTYNQFGAPTIAMTPTNTAALSAAALAAAATTNITVTIPTVPGVARVGLFRVRITRNTANATSVQVTITGTDGTNTDCIFTSATSASVAANGTRAESYYVPFVTDLACTSFTVAVTLAGTGGTALGDVEFVGNPI